MGVSRAQQPVYKNRTICLIGMLHAFTHLYQVALIPLYLRIQQDLKLSSVEQATLLVTVLGVAYFSPSYFLGSLADNLNRKKLLALGLALNGLGFIGLALAPNYPLAVISVIVAGFGGSFYHPAATALIARLFPEARGRALGFVGIGASVGFFAGPVYAGWRAVVTGSWRTPVAELGVLGLAAAALFNWLASEDTRNTPPAISRKSTAAAKTKLFPTAALWALFLGASFALSLRDFAGNALSTSASLFLQKVHGFDPKATGLALSGIFLASIISNPLFGSLSDRGRMRWVAFVLLMAAALVSVFPRVPVHWMSPTLLGFGFFFIASYPITEAALMESVPDEIRGRVFGLFITVGGLVGNLAHWLVGGWIKRLGAKAYVSESYFPLYAFISGLIVLSVLGLPLLRALRKREHLPNAQNGLAAFSAVGTPDAP